MAIEFPCMRCGQKLRVDDHDAGNMARCPACQAVVDIPPKGAPALPVVMARDKSDVIDYELFGQESQYVEITLDPSEVTFARMDNLIYMTSGIAVEDAAESGDSDRDSNGGLGVLKTISQVGRRMRGGSSLPMTAFCNVAEKREVVAFAPKSPSRLIPIHMDEFDEQLFCQSSAILCLARGIEIRDNDASSHPATLATHLLRGDGIAILQVPGQLHHRQLDERTSINVATQNIVAFTAKMRLSEFPCPGVTDPVGVTTVKGPGEIWLKTGRAGSHRP